MGIEAKTFQALASQVDQFHRNKYLFFGDQLYIGAPPFQPHDEILGGSGRQVGDVKTAGMYSIYGDNLVINANGSMTLQIDKGDPTSVVEFVKSFSDIAEKTIIPRE